ncbi:MAG: 16S rRNA (cytosine(1402)-N(4))-methyltransferase RsmH, partial [Clostridia bacterium]|nr:16S rRNA (cytosine(1402)-N(4))-methyltransferase RsmH [Clostridia bacterium]
MADFHHVSVMLTETVDALSVKPEGIYVDCTLGGGGHSHEILRRSPDAVLYGIDRDGEAIEAASARLSEFRNFTPVRSNYTELGAVAEEYGFFGKADGILFDLGVSSHQLDDESRGFSYHASAPLDMRMDKRQEVTAATLVN